MVDIALQQYERGLISYQPLLDSQRALVAQQDTLTDSRGMVAADLVAIYRAMGGGWRALIRRPLRRHWRPAHRRFQRRSRSGTRRGEDRHKGRCTMRFGKTPPLVRFRRTLLYLGAIRRMRQQDFAAGSSLFLHG